MMELMFKVIVCSKPAYLLTAYKNAIVVRIGFDLMKPGPLVPSFCRSILLPFHSFASIIVGSSRAINASPVTPKKARDSVAGLILLVQF